MDVVDPDDGVIGVQQAPASEEALDAFETTHGVKLPSAFRQLYGLSDGTTEMDGHEQIFWPISAMGNVLGSFDGSDSAAHWIGFADFRLQTEVFYLRIDRTDGTASVWLDRARQVTESFDAFLEGYASHPLFWQT